MKSVTKYLRKIGISGIGLLAFAISAQASDKTLGVSMPTLAGPWYTAILYGITSKAEELGYKVVVLDAGGYGNVENQISQVSNLITQQVDALLIDPANPAAFNGVALQAKNAGIPVIGVATPIVADEVPADGATTSSHCDLGQAMAIGAKQLLPDGGKLAVLEGPPGAFWASERLRCFLIDIEDSGINVVASKATEQDTALSLSTANDFLQLHPDLNMLYGAGDTYGVGAARALQQIGKCGETKVLHAVFGETSEEMMKQGCIDYIVAQKPVEIGAASVEVADALISKTITSGSDEAMRVSTVVPVTPGTMDAIDLSPIRPPVGWRP